MAVVERAERGETDGRGGRAQERQVGAGATGELALQQVDRRWVVQQRRLAGEQADGGVQIEEVGDVGRAARELLQADLRELAEADERRGQAGRGDEADGAAEGEGGQAKAAHGGCARLCAVEAADRNRCSTAWRSEEHTSELQSHSFL